jgi:hypothetical protein
VMKPFRIQSDLWDDFSFYARFFIKCALLLRMFFDLHGLLHRVKVHSIIFDFI